MIFAFNIGFLEVSWVDIIDISLVSFFLYQLYKLMRGSVAVKILVGVLSLYFVYLFVRAAQMELLSMILGQFMGVGVLAAIILFQPELRKFLLLVGRTTDFNKESFFKNLVRWRRKEQERAHHITPVIEAARAMGASNTGALVVFSKDTQLKFYAETGDLIDAEISKRLLLSIFDKHSPLHDGAIIIHKGRIVAARCVLPVSENDSLPAQLGLRHRAALGMSETTDTLILIVSEETGQLSIAHDGEIKSNLTPIEIRQEINDYLFGINNDHKKSTEEELSPSESTRQQLKRIDA